MSPEGLWRVWGTTPGVWGVGRVSSGHSEGQGLASGALPILVLAESHEGEGVRIHCTGDAEAVPSGRGVETWRAQAALRPVQRLEGDGWAERRGEGPGA